MIAEALAVMYAALMFLTGVIMVIYGFDYQKNVVLWLGVLLNATGTALCIVLYLFGYVK